MSRMSMPSMRTMPPVGSYSRAISAASVVLPDPVSPTRASVLPAGTSMSMPVTAGPRGAPEGWGAWPRGGGAGQVDVDAGHGGPVGARVGEADILEADVPAGVGRVDLGGMGGIFDVH